MIDEYTIGKSGLKVGSRALKNYVSLVFAIIDAFEYTIGKSNVPA